LPLHERTVLTQAVVPVGQEVMKLEQGSVTV
jgi:hypothetical protein